jgi:hypothetical protein
LPDPRSPRLSLSHRLSHQLGCRRRERRWRRRIPQALRRRVPKSFSVPSYRRRRTSPFPSLFLDRTDEKEQSTKSKKHLSLLNSWIHHDCTSETVVDDIEDLVLRGLVYTRIAETAKKEMGVRGINGGLMLKGGRIGFAFARKSAMSEEVGE